MSPDAEQLEGSSVAGPADHCSVHAKGGGGGGADTVAAAAAAADALGHSVIDHATQPEVDAHDA